MPQMHLKNTQAKPEHLDPKPIIMVSNNSKNSSNNNNSSNKIETLKLDPKPEIYGP